MALKDRKITEAGIADHGVVSAPDRLRGTAAENKKVFDKLVRAVVAEKVNGIVDDLTSTEEGASGAAQLGISQIEGVKAVNVQEALQALKTDPAVVAVQAQKAAEEALEAAATAQRVAEETAEETRSEAETAQNRLTETAEEKINEVEALAKSAKSWAVGGTESREGEDENNAKYWSEQARREIEAALEDFEGVASFNGRDGAVVPLSGDYTAEMVGASPAGYGLGDEIARHATDANSCIENGWYRGITTNRPPNGIVDGWMFVVSHSVNYKIQYWFNSVTGGTNPSSVTAQRFMWAGTWGEWEFVNPPMTLGVEYRTIERYKGKPVYAKILDCGTFPEKGATKKITLTADNTFETWVGCTVVTKRRGDGIKVIVLNANGGSPDEVSVIAHPAQNFVVLVNNTAEYWDDTCAFCKYTKTTD